MNKKIRLQVKLFTSFIKSSGTIVLLFWEMILGILSNIVSVLIFIKIRGEVLEKELLPLDLSILQFFYHLRSPVLNKVMIAITYLGGEAMIGFGILIAIFLLLERHRREAMLFTFILGMAEIIDLTLKNLVQRPRPQFHPLVIAKDFSFPSGHAMDSFVFYLTLSYLFFHLSKNKKIAMIITALSLILILLIGISRIYLGVHYPTDVVAGYLGGLFWLTSVLLINKTLIFYKVFKETQDKLPN